MAEDLIEVAPDLEYLGATVGATYLGIAEGTGSGPRRVKPLRRRAILGWNRP